MRVSASDIRTDPRRATVLPADEPGQDRGRAKTGQFCETAGRADYRTDVLMKDFVSGTAVRKGAVKASATQVAARPTYSDISKGPIAFTIQSYRIAAPSAIVLPKSSAHHAQRSPRRKAVAAIPTPSSPNATLYAPYVRKSRVMNAPAIGDVPARADHDSLVKPSYPAGRMGAAPGPDKCSGNNAAIAPHATNPTSTTAMATQAKRRRVVIAILRPLRRLFRYPSA